MNVPTAFEVLWSSSNNIKTLYEIKQNEKKNSKI